MRVEAWSWDNVNADMDRVTTDQMVEAAEVIAQEVRSRAPVGTTSRPMYRKGVYAGQPWTARDAGQLKKSVRVVRKRTPKGRLSKKKNVRVYVGHYLAYYASIVEHSEPFMRPAVVQTHARVKQILGAK